MTINIAGKKILQDYHAVLYKLTGIAIDYISETGEIMTLCPAEHYNPLCSYIYNCPGGAAACARADRENIEKAAASKKSVIYECHAGLIDIIVPLFVNGQYIGCLTTGQILKQKPTKKSFREFLNKVKTLKLNEEQLREYYFKTVVMSERQIEAMVELMSLVGNYILESENKLLFLESINERKKVLAARQFIEQNYKKKLTVDNIANSVFLSESHFGHIFKHEVGISPINYLNRFRIDKAKELLRNTKSSITDIAYSVGFNSLPHFNRIFKEMEGVSPGYCRKKQNTLKS
jgi:AraC-like DNA-binding protein